MSERIHTLFMTKVRAARATQSTTAPASKAPLDLEALKPEGMTWHDYLILLLQIGAELEHCLMVQYLYAGYSLGGPRVLPEHRPAVRKWQEAILTIAREEMGHLLAVQNMLVLLGGPINLARQDAPWDSPFYPCPFELEPVSLDSLACYLWAEMPPEVPATPKYAEFHAVDLALIRAAVAQRSAPTVTAHHVDEIYESIIAIVSDPRKIPDSAFNADTWDRQLSWDEFAKGYGPQHATPRPADSEGTQRASTWPARVIVPQMATRTMMIDALRDIAGQGESPHLGDDTLEPSHFDRFLEVYQELRRLGAATITHDIVTNPTTVPSREGDATYLRNPRARSWAALANMRYRLLLAYLTHLYHLPITAESHRPGTRPGTMHRIFSEMYNLKALCGLLAHVPAHGDGDGPFTGAPFEVPYVLNLPDGERNRWRAHRDTHQASIAICDELLVDEPTLEGQKYLTALRELDRQSLAWLEQMLGIPVSTPRVTT